MASLDFSELRRLLMKKPSSHQKPPAKILPCQFFLKAKRHIGEAETFVHVIVIRDQDNRVSHIGGAGIRGIAMAQGKGQ